MNELKLITPVSGQTNWGNAINSNFTLLLNKYKSMLAEYQKLNNRLEELDTLKIKQDYFIYITNNKIYLNPIANWDKTEGLISTEIDFSSDEYINYDAWFIKIDNDSNGEDYNGTLWHTGDLLILYKNSSINYNVEQWTGIMGGYYEPIETEIVDDTLKTTYRQQPSFYGNKVTKINAPLIHWRPVSYLNGELTYRAYDGNKTAVSGLGDQSFQTAVIIRASVNTYTFSHVKEIVDHTISIPDIELPVSELGYQIIWTDGNNNILYFPYTMEKDGTTLVIHFYYNKFVYSGTINMKISIFQ